MKNKYDYFSGDYTSKLHSTELNRLIQKLNSFQETPVEILFILIHIQILFFPSLFALLLRNKKKMFLSHFQAVILYLNQLNG